MDVSRQDSNANSWCTLLDYEGWERRHPCRCGSTLLTMKNTEQGTLWYAAHRCLYQGLNQIYVAPGAEGVYLNPGWDTSIFFSLRPSARPCVELHAGCSTRTDTFATTWTRPPPLGPRNFFLLFLSLSFPSFSPLFVGVTSLVKNFERYFSLPSIFLLIFGWNI